MFVSETEEYEAPFTTVPPEPATLPPVDEFDIVLESISAVAKSGAISQSYYNALPHVLHPQFILEKALEH
jgi:hypothetical protein